MIEVSTTGSAREARYELDFSRHRILFAVFVVIGAPWIAFGAFVLDDGATSLEVAIQTAFVVIFGVPAMGILLFNAGKASTAQRFERLLRRALTG